MNRPVITVRDQIILLCLFLVVLFLFLTKRDLTNAEEKYDRCKSGCKTAGFYGGKIESHSCTCFGSPFLTSN